MRILLAGLPGSGKTTQARILADKFSLPLISTGVILREIVSENTEEAARLRGILNSGKLVEDDEIAEIVKKRLSTISEDGFIFDGYPRSLEQLKLFDPGYDKVIYLRVGENLVKDRLIHRGRPDDDPGVIEERFDVYHHETEPLIEHFKEQGILETIDGSGSIEEVKARIEEALNNG